MDGAKRLAMVETKTISGGAAVTPLVSMFRYQLGNHLGSAVLEVDAAGLIISYEEYSPYGSSAYRSSRSGVDVSARRYRYVGLERDNETGLDSMGARYYAAWLGRWTSADPLGVGADGPGVYNYTRGSPVVLTDPGGMEGGKPNPFFSGSYKDRPAVQCKPTDESAASRAASAAFVEMFGTGSLPTYGPAVGQSQTASEPKPMDESIVDSLDRGAASVLQVGVDAVLFGLEHGVARPLSSLSGTANAPTSETEAAAGEESMGDAEFGLRVGLLRLGLTKSGAGPLALFNMATTVSSHDDPDMIPATIGVAAGLRVQSGAPEAAAPVASETIAAQLRDQVAQLRKSENIGKQRNTAGSALELRGEVVETNLAVSGLKERGPTRAGPQQRLLVAKKLGHMRDTDSEFKLFENFANEHSTQTRGTLHVYTDRVPCDSCVDVAVQLESIFPNLKVQFYWGDYK